MTITCGDELYLEFFGDSSSIPHELGAAEQLLISAAVSSSTAVLNKATVDSLLLVALEQFKDRYPWLLLFALEKYEDLGTTQKEDTEKTLAKISNLSKHCL